MATIGSLSIVLKANASAFMGTGTRRQRSSPKPSRRLSIRCKRQRLHRQRLATTRVRGFRC